jgi:two-component system, NarL family, nitrate/nitrite response regulator NarL
MRMSENNQISRIAVCETQPITAEGIQRVLEGCPEFEFVGAVQSLPAAMDLVVELHPALMILDKAVGVQPLLDWHARLPEMRLAVATVVWGTTITEAEALRFFQVGARGILRKTADPAMLRTCLAAVCQGNTWMEDAVFRDLMPRDRFPRSELTAREQQVMELVEQGLKNREIGRELGIRPGTVKIHLKHIFEKTGVRGRYGLALSGLVSQRLHPNGNGTVRSVA